MGDLDCVYVASTMQEAAPLSTAVLLTDEQLPALVKQQAHSLVHSPKHFGQNIKITTTLVIRFKKDVAQECKQISLALHIVKKRAWYCCWLHRRKLLLMLLCKCILHKVGLTG